MFKTCFVDFCFLILYNNERFNCYGYRQLYDIINYIHTEEGGIKENTMKAT